MNWLYFEIVSAEIACNEPRPRCRPGFGILELAGGLVPQGGLVKTARFGWKFVWLQMMRELAPQSPDGSYVR